MNIYHYINHPDGLDDFTTQWLHEFLILAAWQSDILCCQGLPIIDYAGSYLKRF